MSSAQFDKAVSIIQALPKDGPIKPSQSDQLEFYGLYKQATEGDNTKPKPGMLDFTGKYKWDAWTSRKGLSSDEAKKLYVEAFFKVFEAQAGSSDDAQKYIDEVKAAA